MSLKFEIQSLIKNYVVVLYFYFYFPLKIIKSNFVLNFKPLVLKLKTVCISMYNIIFEFS